MTILSQFLSMALFGACLSACVTAPDNAPSNSTVFGEAWNGGTDKHEPQLQAQYYDRNTVVIRQSLHSSFEAPFIYMVFGEEKVLLIDTGAGGVDLRSIVDDRIATWLDATGLENISLIVMHTHGHGDHIAGDEQFAGRPSTVVVGHSAGQVAEFFSLNDWPNEGNSIDLGGRVVDVIPTPGHHDSHVMIYDRSTRLLFSGDVIYPGRLYFQCGKADAFGSSIERVAEFADTHEVSWILGAHIELAHKPGISFDSNDVVRDNERHLEMKPSVIKDIQTALSKMGPLLRVEDYGDFIIFPYPADPRGMKPPDWCLNDNNAN